MAYIQCIAAHRTVLISSLLTRTLINAAPNTQKVKKDMCFDLAPDQLEREQSFLFQIFENKSFFFYTFHLFFNLVLEH